MHDGRDARWPQQKQHNIFVVYNVYGGVRERERCVSVWSVCLCVIVFRGKMRKFWYIHVTTIHNLMKMNKHFLF